MCGIMFLAVKEGDSRAIECGLLEDEIRQLGEDHLRMCPRAPSGNVTPGKRTAETDENVKPAMKKTETGA